MVTQFVQVQFPATYKAWTYLWEGEEPLKIGDNVEVPGNSFHPQPQVAKVVALTSDYVGRIVNITKKIP